VLLVWAVVCVARAAGARLPWWGELVIAAALVGWYPFYWDLIFGQLMVLLLALLAGAWLALRSGRSVLGGVLVGLAVLVKLIPWPLFLLLVLRRDWRALGASIATALLGYAATGWAMGPDRLLAYFTRVAPDVGHMYEASAVNLSLWAPGRRLFEGTPRGEYAGMDITAPPLVESPLAAMVISVAVPALVLAGACFWARNQRGLGPSLGVMVCVVVLVSPIAWPHYFVLAVIPATQVINWLVRHRLPKRETIAALVLGSLLLLPSEHWQLLAHLAAGQLPVQGQTSVLPVTPALLTLGPACALAGLAWLLAVLAAREQGWGEPASAVRRLTR
jgi:hypothetical protein